MGIRNKKGIFFTTLVLVILTLFLISFTLFAQINERRAVQKRVESLNNFLISIEKDLPRQLYASSFRIIFLLEKRILESGNYVDNVELRFVETFFDGTVYGETNGEIESIMEGATYGDIKEAINAKANKINAVALFDSPNVIISQDNPWYVTITLEFDFTLKDKGDLVSWSKFERVIISVPVEGFVDPTYPLEKNDIALAREIVNSTYYPFASNQDIINHANAGAYIANPDAPSFLDRLEGNIEAENPNGIESLAVPKLPSISGVSIVDHEYFQNTPGTHSNPGLPSWFVVDSGHASVYSAG